MSELGSRMFKGGAIGGGAGFATGLAKSAIDIRNALSKIPEKTVDVPGYEKPVEDTVYIDYSSRNAADGLNPRLHQSYLKTTARNPDGSVMMEKVPPTKVTGRGDPVITYKNHRIEDPYVMNEEVERSTRIETYTDSDGHLQTRTTSHTDTDTYIYKKQLGSWAEPRVEFADGISRLGVTLKNVALFTALGICLGTLGGALYHAAIEK